MQEDSALQLNLRQLAELQVSLINKGGPAADGELFETILSMQDDILERFGLPVSPDYEPLVWFENNPTDSEIGERINKLHLSAWKYLTGTVKSDLQLLENAIETQGNAMHILPELKIPTHSYTIFVFNEILLKKNDSAQNVLDEFKLCNCYEVLDALGTLQFKGRGFDTKLNELIGRARLKYVEQFFKTCR